MDLLLKDKIVVVTGASKGLGFACARTLCEEGAIVILVSRSEENLKVATAKLKDIPNAKFAYFIADISNKNDIEGLKKWVAFNYDKVHGIIINAGGPPTGNSLSFDDKAWQNAYETNLMSVVRICETFVPLMQKEKFGRIVAITSMSAKSPLPNLVLSNTLRVGVSGFIKTLSNEVGKDNILINAVLPGMTLTERLQTVIENWAKMEHKSIDQVIKERTNQIPLQRFGTPEEFSAVVAFLISGRNTYITGQSIAIDGGSITSVW
jgi:3-oxoacyl-[acyl-carrier protein] reductase